jgi:hypothetical protein
VQVTTSFTQDRSGVSLTNMMQTREVTEGFQVDSTNRELTYRRFNNLPQDIYYWKLPERFLGDKVRIQSKILWCQMLVRLPSSTCVNTAFKAFVMPSAIVG